MKRMFFRVFLVAISLMFMGCHGSSNHNPAKAKAITAFSFSSPATIGVISEISHSIAVAVPYETDVTALIPTITHTGVSISPAAGDAQDFSAPVIYTITAADSSEQAYTVTVTAAPIDAKAITSFSFQNPSAVGTITEDAHSITVIVPYGTDVTVLTPIVIHTGTSIIPLSGEEQDFTTPVVYTVTAADSSEQDYTVTVTAAPVDAKAITAFRFANLPAEGTITEATHLIAVTVPYGSDVTALIPTIIHTGTSIIPLSGEEQDFTTPVVYTVFADDASTQDYTVTVTVAPVDAKAIIAFSFASPAIEGTITEATHSISITMPNGTEIKALTPAIIHTGVSISPVIGEAQDFTGPVVYMVTAGDASTQDYTVTVTVIPWAACGDVLNYEGENYPTVQIDTECWLAKNLNVGSAVLAANGQGTDCADIQKFCYGDDESNCTTYGGLYTWTQAMCGAVIERSQGICPDGWHIPSDPEYVAITNYLGNASCGTYRMGNSNYCGAPAGDRMKAPGLCEGRTPCGDSGFNGVMTGQLWVNVYNIAEYSYAGLDRDNLSWTSSRSNYSSYGEAWRSGLAITQGGVDSTYFFSPPSSGRAIRCMEND